jgi:hypothetical protein
MITRFGLASALHTKQVFKYFLCSGSSKDTRSSGKAILENKEVNDVVTVKNSLAIKKLMMEV